ncbi:MAG: hypothetical protein K8R48_06800 [Alphaproteobacteria bacterium]|nr:hypothetical protein [Alphaproteobacteria bacterium]
MSLKKTLLAGFAGFCLCQSFNVATNPLTHQGFVNNIETVVTEPGLVLYGAVERPGEVFGFLTLGGAAIALANRKKKQEGPTAKG